MDVTGVDLARGGWIFVTLRDGAFHGARFARTFADGLAAHAEATPIGVDIPIGLHATAGRRSDVEAKRWLGRRASSLFIVPPRSVVETASYVEANARSRAMDLGGLSRQSHGLARRILEVDALAAADARLFEVHPEVSFHALRGRSLDASKHTWAGFVERRALLVEAGIVVPDDIGPAALHASPDDVLDAAAAAWTAWRRARGHARSLPDPPEVIDGRPVAIWY